ncbi:MAG: hypothetical protein R3F43_12505 [bacterium]
MRTAGGRVLAVMATAPTGRRRGAGPTRASRTSSFRACRPAGTWEGRHGAELSRHGRGHRGGGRGGAPDDGGGPVHLHGPEVLPAWAPSAACSRADVPAALDASVLVASTDGVGTMTKRLPRPGRYDTLGEDLRQPLHQRCARPGGTPPFFLDYVAASKLIRPASPPSCGG